MHKLIRIAASAALAAVIAPASAADPQRVEIVVPRAVATDAVMKQLDAETTFQMSSGRRMTVAVVAEDRLSLRYGRHLRRVLVADGSGAFVSSDGQVSLGFDFDGGGDIRQVRLSLPARQL